MNIPQVLAPTTHHKHSLLQDWQIALRNSIRGLSEGQISQRFGPYGLHAFQCGQRGGVPITHFTTQGTLYLICCEGYTHWTAERRRRLNPIN